MFYSLNSISQKQGVQWGISNTDCRINIKRPSNNSSNSAFGEVSKPVTNKAAKSASN